MYESGCCRHSRLRSAAVELWVLVGPFVTLEPRTASSQHLQLAGVVSDARGVYLPSAMVRDSCGVSPHHPYMRNGGGAFEGVYAPL